MWHQSVDSGLLFASPFEVMRRKETKLRFSRDMRRRGFSGPGQLSTEALDTRNRQRIFCSKWLRFLPPEPGSVRLVKKKIQPVAVAAFCSGG